VMPSEPVRIVTLPGDGIGPEVMAAALTLLDAVGRFEVEERLIGGASIDEHGIALTDDVILACKGEGVKAVLLGAVGGPKWDTTDQSKPRPEQGLLRLRRDLGKDGEGLYANLRPVRPQPALLDASPLKREIIEGTDLLVVRELTGGIYYGEHGVNQEGKTFDTCEYDEQEIVRIAKIAFEQARFRAAERGRPPKVTSVDKANVMRTSRLWRAVVERVHEELFAEVKLEHLLVDNAAAQLVARPASFDVILTENTFGDILSDEAAMLTGSIGMLPSASVDEIPPGLYEPAHGSAPDIAGKGIANPLAMFLTVAMMLRIQLFDIRRAAEIEQAVEIVLDQGLRTPDLMRAGDSAVDSASAERAELRVVGTEEMTAAVVGAYRDIHRIGELDSHPTDASLSTSVG
jgi:3-isopropylmalate dehydrogenase